MGFPERSWGWEPREKENAVLSPRPAAAEALALLLVPLPFSMKAQGAPLRGNLERTAQGSGDRATSAKVGSRSGEEGGEDRAPHFGCLQAAAAAGSRGAEEETLQVPSLLRGAGARLAASIWWQGLEVIGTNTV